MEKVKSDLDDKNKLERNFMRKRNLFKFIICSIIIFSVVMTISSVVFASDEILGALPNIDINIGGESGTQATSSTIQVLLLIAVITLAPTLIILLTSFTRIVITLHFLRAALGTQQMPPNQILIGLSLFLTIFIMSPTIAKISEEAFEPYSQGQISQEEFIDKSMDPIREFMFRQVENKDLKLFADISGDSTYEKREDIPNSVLIPAFILGEITKGFKIGFVLYIPFIAIDMVVASTLMAMGMMMLPPALISAPFKLLLFIMVDGWNLVISNLMKTFR